MKASNTPKLVIRFGMIVAAVILLCNPNINLVDVMPDFVAYLLLYTALTYAGAGNPYLSDCREGFKKLMWVNLSKIPALILMMMIRGGDSSQKSIVTVFALCYAVIELTVAIPAFNAFFEGLFYFRDRYDCPVIDGNSSPSTKVTVLFLKKLTLAFVVTKAVLSTLPELALISVKEYNPTPMGRPLVISRYYPFFALIGAVLALAVGLVWAVYMCRYIRYIGADGSIDRVCEETYRSYYPDVTAQNRQARISGALLILAVGVGFNLDLIFDDINVLPDCLSALLLALGAWRLLPFARRACYAVWASVAYGVSSLVSYILTVLFLDKYTYEMIGRKMEAARAYTTLTWASAVELLLGVAALLFVMRSVNEVIFSHSGRIYDDPYKNGSEEEKRGSLKNRMLIASLLGVLSLLAAFVQVILSGYTEFVELNTGAEHGYMYIPEVAWFWIVPLLLTLAWVVCFATTTSDIRKNVQRRYSTL